MCCMHACKYGSNYTISKRDKTRSQQQIHFRRNSSRSPIVVQSYYPIKLAFELLIKTIQSNLPLKIEILI